MCGRKFMKRPNIKCIGLLVLSAFAMGAMGGCSSTGSRVDSAIVRDATSKVEQEGMFSSICKTDDNGVFSVKAAKPFAGKDLAGYETVADEPEEEYQVVYDLSASSEDGAVTLNIRFNDSGEEIIDPFIGEPMTNGEGEEDVLFTIYGEHVMMSEFVEAASQNEECGWFSNLASKIKKAVEDKAGTIAHKTLNAAMAACVIVEPAARLFALTHNDITRTVYAVYRTARQTVYVTNYVSNSKQTQPSGYVYAQSEYGSRPGPVPNAIPTPRFIRSLSIRIRVEAIGLRLITAIATTPAIPEPTGIAPKTFVTLPIPRTPSWLPTLSKNEKTLSFFNPCVAFGFLRRVKGHRYQKRDLDRRSAFYRDYFRPA